jgi:hypothetical protein
MGIIPEWVSVSVGILAIFPDVSCRSQGICVCINTDDAAMFLIVANKMYCIVFTRGVVLGTSEPGRTAGVMSTLLFVDQSSMTISQRLMVFYLVYTFHPYSFPFFPIFRKRLAECRV